MAFKRMSALSFETPDGYSVNIPLYTTNTVLRGDSGIGKSYIYNSLRSLANARKLPFKCACFDKDSCSALTDILKYPYAGLIVIEDFDIVKRRFPEIVPRLNTGEYQTLLIGRDTVDVYTHIFHIYYVQKVGKRIVAKPLIYKHKGV